MLDSVHEYLFDLCVVGNISVCIRNLQNGAGVKYFEKNICCGGSENFGFGGGLIFPGRGKVEVREFLGKKEIA